MHVSPLRHSVGAMEAAAAAGRAEAVVERERAAAAAAAAAGAEAKLLAVQRAANDEAMQLRVKLNASQQV
jgi:hypothetical protein